MSTISLSTASTLAFTDAALPMGTAPTDGQVLVRSGSTITGAAAASGLPSTGGTGIVAQTAASTTAARTITGTANRLTVSNGDGVAGNPTLDVGSNVYVAGGTDVAVADGGTGASTAAGARDNIVFASAGAIDPASPYTVAAGVNTITLGSSKTVALPALSTYADGQVLRVINSTSSAIIVTLDPDGTETIDGGGAGASAAYTVAARGSVGAVRLSATAWGSVQSGSVVTSRGLIYLSGGVWYGVGQGLSAPGTWTNTTTPVAFTELRADAAVSLSGADATVVSGTTTILQPDDMPGVWYIALSDLGLSASQRLSTVGVVMTATTLPAVDYATLGAATLSAAWVTQAQTQNGASWWYETTRKAKSVTSTGNLTTVNSANTEVVLLSVPSFGTTGGWMGGRLADNSAQLNAIAIAGTATQTTHIGIFLGATGGTTGADATWVAPRFVVTVTGS